MGISLKQSISVVIPVYNGSQYITRAIDSVLEQNLPVEIYIIDDCSSDQLYQALEPYQQLKNIHIKRNSSNLGVAASRNKGVSMCNTEYIAFLDADDWWMPGKLEAQLELIEKTGACLCSTARELVDTNGNPLHHIIPIKEKISYFSLLFHNSLSCSAVIARKDILLEFPMNHDDSHEDYITWLKITKKYGPAIGLNKPFLKYRLSANSKSRNKLKSARMTYMAYRYIGLPIPSAVFFLFSYMINGIFKYYFYSKK